MPSLPLARLHHRPDCAICRHITARRLLSAHHSINPHAADPLATWKPKKVREAEARAASAAAVAAPTTTTAASAPPPLAPPSAADGAPVPAPAAEGQTRRRQTTVRFDDGACAGSGASGGVPSAVTSAGSGCAVAKFDEAPRLNTVLAGLHDLRAASAPSVGSMTVANYADTRSRTTTEWTDNDTVSYRSDAMGLLVGIDSIKSDTDDSHDLGECRVPSEYLPSTSRAPPEHLQSTSRAPPEYLPSTSRVPLNGSRCRLSAAEHHTTGHHTFQHGHGHGPSCPLFS